GVKRFWYRKAEFVDDGINFSPTFNDPLSDACLPAEQLSAFGIVGFLDQAHARPGHMFGGPKTAAAVHLGCPALGVLDGGKSRVKVPPEVCKQIGNLLWRVCKDIYREEERRRKDANRQARADRRRERQEQDKYPDLSAAVFEVMPQAIEKASGKGFVRPG